MTLLSGIVDSGITLGWVLLWFVAVGLAIWQILRGRALAGAALGAAAIVGLGHLAARRLLSALFALLANAVGYPVAGVILDLLHGSIYAAVLVLLVVAAVLQRPPKPASDPPG